MVLGLVICSQHCVTGASLLLILLLLAVYLWLSINAVQRSPTFSIGS